MLFDFEERPSESPWVERVWRARAKRAGSFISIAASHWEMVVTRFDGSTTLTVRGPETAARPMVCRWTGAEFVGIIFRLGIFMPHLPPGRVMEGRDVNLPAAVRDSFWLHGSAWQYPTYDSADAFVDRLVHEGLITREPLVQAALLGQVNEASVRTTQRQFQRATGLSYRAIRQIERARYATTLLQQGASIPDTVFEAGYFDHAHLTRSLARFVGQTPAQLMDTSRAVQLSLLYKTAPLLPRYGISTENKPHLEAADEEDQAGDVRLARWRRGKPGLDRAVLER